MQDVDAFFTLHPAELPRWIHCVGRYRQWLVDNVKRHRGFEVALGPQYRIISAQKALTRTTVFTLLLYLTKCFLQCDCSADALFGPLRSQQGIAAFLGGYYEMVNVLCRIAPVMVEYEALMDS